MRQVLAVDGGDPARTGSAEVILTVHDVDDNQAVFTELTYQFSVREDSPVGSVVGTVTAVDADLPPHNSVYYWLIDDKDSQNFHIDPHNGQWPLDHSFTSYVFSLSLITAWTCTCRPTPYVAGIELAWKKD